MNKLSKIQENINLLKQKMADNAKGNRLFEIFGKLTVLVEYDEKHLGLKQNKESLDVHFRSMKKGIV